MSDIFEMLKIVREKRYVLNNRAMYFYRRAKVAEERLNHWDAKVMLEEADYAACLSPANYPMPAIPLSIEQNDYGVFIFHSYYPWDEVYTWGNVYACEYCLPEDEYCVECGRGCK